MSASLSFEGGPLDEIDLEDNELTPDNTWLAKHPGRVLPRGKLCAGGELAKNDEGNLADAKQRSRVEAVGARLAEVTAKLGQA